MSEKIVNRILFGKRLKKYREEKGYTQFSLSEKIGISQNFLGDIERGLKLPSADTLIKIVNTLKISVDSLFADSLDNIVNEEKSIYYTEKQLSIVNEIVRNYNAQIDIITLPPSNVYTKQIAIKFVG